jgi:polar amino acid transport system substrate-binding protein
LNLNLVIVALAALLLQRSDVAPGGTLRAMFIGDNPVQGRVDPQTRAVTGLAADLTRELAARLGVPYTIVPAASAEAVIAGVKTHTADIGFLAYNDARAQEIDFSESYVISTSAYLVRADSAFNRSSDVDRAGVTIGTVKGVSQQLYISAQIKNARVELLPAAPSPEGIAALLIARTLDVFGANRERMEQAARTSPQVRVLPDNFMVTAQTIAVDKGQSSRLAEINRFIADVRGSGFVKASLDRANVAGVEVAPAK